LGQATFLIAWDQRSYGDCIAFIYSVGALTHLHGICATAGRKRCTCHLLIWIGWSQESTTGGRAQSEHSAVAHPLSYVPMGAAADVPSHSKDRFVSTGQHALLWTIQRRVQLRASKCVPRCAVSHIHFQNPGLTVYLCCHAEADTYRSSPCITKAAQPLRRPCRFGVDLSEDALRELGSQHGFDNLSQAVAKIQRLAVKYP
jgi:hypothetical protein